MIPANMIPVNAIFDSDLHRRTEGTSSASLTYKSGSIFTNHKWGKRR